MSIAAELASVRRILLCLRWGIGDVVNETPLLTALRRAAPHASITALGARPAIELLDTDPRIDHLLSVQEWGVNVWTDCGTEHLRRHLRRWARDAFDLVLDALHAPLAVRYSVGEAGVPVRNADEARHLNHAALHGIVGTINGAARAGWGVEVAVDAAPALHLHELDYAAADRVLRGIGVDGAQPAAIAPLGSSSVKHWAPERFAAVADWLASRGLGSVLVFAGPSPEIAHAVVRAMRRAAYARIIPPIHLRTAAALLARCSILVSNDTGLMHVGGAVGVPCVGLFGPTSPHLYRPYSPRAIAIAARQPCHYRKLVDPGPPICATMGYCLAGHNGCMYEIHPDRVIDAVRNVLQLARADGVLSHRDVNTSGF